MSTPIAESPVTETEFEHESRLVPTSTFGPLPRRAGIALLAAVLANLVVLGGALLVGVTTFQPLNIVAVATTSAIALLGAAVVYGALARFTTRTNRNFTVVATLVLLLSAGTLNFAFTLPGATTVGVATLGVMHLVAYAVAVVVLTDRRPLA